MVALSDILPETTTENPFHALVSILDIEIYGADRSDSFKRVVYTLICVLGLIFVGSVTALTVKLRRGERWLYKVHDLTEGRLIVPNITLNYLIYNSIFVPIAICYVVFAGLKLSSNLFNVSYWMAFTFLTMFTGLWHVVWGSTASGIMQRARIVSKGKIVVPSMIINGFFIAGLVAAWVSMIATTATAANKWNIGFQAFQQIRTMALQFAQSYTGENTRNAVETSIPTIDELLATMTKGFFNYQNPYVVCACFALLAGVIMAVACVVQAFAMRDQIKPSQSPSFGPGLSSVSSKTSFRDPSLQRMLRNIVITTFTICLSMFAYFAVCFIGNVALHRSAIFHISRSNMAHMIIIMFVYTVIDSVAVSTILYSLFDPETVARSATSQMGTNHTATSRSDRSEKRTMKSTKSWDFDSLNSTNGIEIEVEVKIDVDEQRGRSAV